MAEIPTERHHSQGLDEGKRHFSVKFLKPNARTFRSMLKEAPQGDLAREGENTDFLDATKSVVMDKIDGKGNFSCTSSAFFAALERTGREIQENIHQFGMSPIHKSFDWC